MAAGAEGPSCAAGPAAVGSATLRAVRGRGRGRFGCGRRVRSRRITEPDRHPGAIRAPALDHDGAVFGEEKEGFDEARRFRGRLDRDRPVQVAPFRVNLVECRNRFRVGDDRCFAQLAQLVEDSEGIDPTPQDIGAGGESDLVGRQLRAGRFPSRFHPQRRRCGFPVLGPSCGFFPAVRVAFSWLPGLPSRGVLRTLDFGSGSAGSSSGNAECESVTEAGDIGPACRRLLVCRRR